MSDSYQRVPIPGLREKLCPMLSSRTSPRSFIRSRNGSNRTGGGENPSTNEMGKCQSSVNSGTSYHPEGSSTVGKRSLGQHDDDESQGGKRLRSGSTTRIINTSDMPQRCCRYSSVAVSTATIMSRSGLDYSSSRESREHVYRKHALPISCPRCHTSFESEKHKDEHIAGPVRCEPREVIASAEGMSTIQKEQLRSRKKSAKHVTEAEKWRQMYLILFPNADIASIPSPYYELASTNLDFPSQEMSRYERFLQQEPPHTVRKELELRIDQYLSPIETSLRCQLVGIVRDMQIQLFDLYKSMQYRNVNGADREGIPDIHTDLSPLPRTDEGVDDVKTFEDELQHLHQPLYLEQLADFDSFEDPHFSFSVS